MVYVYGYVYGYVYSVNLRCKSILLFTLPHNRCFPALSLLSNFTAPYGTPDNFWATDVRCIASTTQRPTKPLANRIGRFCDDSSLCCGGATDRSAVSRARIQCCHSH